MMVNEKRPSVPRLRFPKFVAQELREVQLRDVTAECAERNGGDISTMPVMGVSKTEGIVPMRERLVASNISRYKIVQKDWFAYNPMRLNIGSIAQWKGEEDILVSPDYVVFKCLNDSDVRVDPSYLDQFRQSDAWGGFVSEGGDGGVRIRIYYKDLARLRLSLPCTEEQKRVADCLSSLDELTMAETRKLDALGSHKKGLIQQLFPREGETVPRLRHPEFLHAGSWNAMDLGPLTTKVGSGVTPLGGEKTYKSDGRPFVRSQNVGWGELLVNEVAFIDEATHKSFSNSEIRNGDVLLNISGASIGRSAVADSRIAGGNVNQHVCIIRVKESLLSPIFLNQFLISDDGQKQINSSQAGGNRQGLNFGQIKALEIPLPPTSDEQAKVANLLACVDDLITNQKQRIDALKTHKKALMQQLFLGPQMVST